MLINHFTDLAVAMLNDGIMSDCAFFSEFCPLIFFTKLYMQEKNPHLYKSIFLYGYQITCFRIM